MILDIAFCKKHHSQVQPANNYKQDKTLASLPSFCIYLLYFGSDSSWTLHIVMSMIQEVSA
jgi:hypothetical protein